MEPEFIVASLANTQKGRGNLAAATDTALQCVSLPIPPFPTDLVEKKICRTPTSGALVRLGISVPLADGHPVTLLKCAVASCHLTVGRSNPPPGRVALHVATGWQRQNQM